MSVEWDELAAAWDSADTRLYADRTFDSWSRKIAPRITELGEKWVLDFGCGTGLLTEKLAPLCRQIVAIDSSTGMIEMLQRKAKERSTSNITPLVAVIDSSSASRHPELAFAFDVIAASSICSFLSDYESTLLDFVSLLKPGRLFAQWDWLTDMPIERIRSVFSEAGLIDLGIKSEFAMTMNGQAMPVVLGIGSRV